VRQNHWSLRILFLALALSMPAVCQTSENCPWLNAATAAGALKGSVTFTVTRSGADNADATCEFTHQEGAALTSLRIEVDTMKNPSREFSSYSAKCSQNGTPLRAIGNEALICSLHGKNQFSEQVVSRVRERAFLVRISSNLAPSAGRDLREKTQKIAEQVAGFLF
jgi:uncharacterized lipoprotein YajG